LEPFARQTRDLIKRSGLLKQMRCSRDDDEFLLAAEHRKRNAVQFNDLDVVASDDEERCPTRKLYPRVTMM
jgi:hypothetical protein